MHMGHEYLVNMRHFEGLSSVLWGLQGELSQGSFSAVNHCIIVKGQLTDNRGRHGKRILHREPSPSTSSTREEQLRDSVGPPPEEVPRKVAVIHCDIYWQELVVLAEEYTSAYLGPHTRQRDKPGRRLDRGLFPQDATDCEDWPVSGTVCFNFSVFA
jgi:hypothetical protein